MLLNASANSNSHGSKMHAPFLSMGHGTDRQTDRWTDGRMDGRRDRQTDGQTELCSMTPSMRGQEHNNPNRNHKNYTSKAKPQRRGDVQRTDVRGAKCPVSIAAVTVLYRDE